MERSIRVAALASSGVHRSRHHETGAYGVWRNALLERRWLKASELADYQDRLVGIVHALERQWRLLILNLRRLGYTPSPKHDPVMVVREPR